jgi:hypothetical protein
MLFDCARRLENGAGEAMARSPFVVKLEGLPEVTPAAIVNELCGLALAREFALNAPRPAIIDLPDARKS